MSPTATAHIIRREPEEEAPPEDRAPLAELAETQVMSLHEAELRSLPGATFRIPNVARWVTMNATDPKLLCGAATLYYLTHISKRKNCVAKSSAWR